MMDNIQIVYASWCNTKGSDKIWGYFAVTDKPIQSLGLEKPVFVFWGARGKSLQLKQHETGPNLWDLKRSKQRKGYEQVSSNEDFLELCPNFYSEVDEKLTYAILAGNKYKAVEN